jgi:hypothetical protein
MPYLQTRRQHGIFGKKVSRFLSYRRAKRLYRAISRDMDFLESRFLRSRLGHT